jgi:acyl-CoA reductase-like NAD-dependent aldehyde dehydrogenase
MLSMTIGGKPATTLSSFDVVNPATGAVEAHAPECAPEQLDEAMESAADVYCSWRKDEDGPLRAARPRRCRSSAPKRTDRSPGTRIWQTEAA